MSTRLHLLHITKYIILLINDFYHNTLTFINLHLMLKLLIMRRLFVLVISVALCFSCNNKKNEYLPSSTKQEIKSPVYHNTTKEKEPSLDIHVEKAPNGISIADLYKNRNNYANKKVIVRGQVVKINNAIMDRNWVHIKDGTSEAGKSDLTFTTQEDVSVGDIVTFEGIVALDKEFGKGYVYPLVVENATLK